MKPAYTRPRKGPRTLLRFVLGTLLMKLAPGRKPRRPVFSQRGSYVSIKKQQKLTSVTGNLSVLLGPVNVNNVVS